MTEATVHYLNLFLGSGAILLQILAVFALFMLFFGPRKNAYLDFLERYALHIAFLVSLVSSLFTIIYSDIVGFIPCYLCWYQRVFMFPLVFLFGIAIWYKDRGILKYALSLASVGFLISVYQNFFYYFGDSSNLPCDASGVSCYQKLVSEFGGYVSIPMLALTSFFAILTLILVAHFYRKHQI